MSPTVQTIMWLGLLILFAVGVYNTGMSLRPRCRRCGEPLGHKTCIPIVGDDYRQIASLNATGQHQQK